ncbi:myosin-7B-like isoform X1 [Mobula hypostoma]|uniref:myosin-7B-like isoform X1 n=1 Tax=Mobula hypostoma TaxID=723540 RepID=UPI002FC291E5
MTNLRKDKQELKKPIQNRLEEAGGVIASQMEMNSKRESELLRLGRELEESEKKLTSRLQQAEEAADAAQAKCLRLEKIKQQLPIKERGRLRIRNMMCWMCAIVFAGFEQKVRWGQILETRCLNWATQRTPSGSPRPRVFGEERRRRQTRVERLVDNRG